MESFSVAAANNINSIWDGLSASDADLISVTQTLAKEAYVLFQLGKYVDCLKVLNQILEKKSDDPKDSEKDFGENRDKTLAKIKISEVPVIENQSQHVKRSMHNVSLDRRGASPK